MIKSINVDPRRKYYLVEFKETRGDIEIDYSVYKIFSVWKRSDLRSNINKFMSDYFGDKTIEISSGNVPCVFSFNKENYLKMHDTIEVDYEVFSEL